MVRQKPPVAFSYRLFKSQTFLKTWEAWAVIPKQLALGFLITAVTSLLRSISKFLTSSLDARAIFSVVQLSQKNTEELPLLFLLFYVPVEQAL
jgi:hypothetical protein